ncbi:nucleotide exchange factor GrpE [Abyssisolibacter fermentans]|uniref:nucleotide exchange factor GrpE n=1 Tax=Abyssisolibacter fermentans TaxID=1766203 RepID=UPI00082CA376|nr:nucleotide exchange factor GrpE [Abyssisolibacter fermentans]
MCKSETKKDISEEASDKEYSCEEEQGEEQEKNYEKELAELNDRYIRLQADFINYRKRVEKEKQSLSKYANQALITDLLVSLDNIERALESVDEDTQKDNLYKGIEMVYKQIIDIFNKNHLEEIKALNCKFDPNLHHAVMQEACDEYGEDTVIEVFQKGYKLYDRVIRPSVVKVSK